MQEKKGKVWLVGAGPSDEGLLTLKGQRLLKQADVIVYDSLVGEGILCGLPREKELIDVGKRAGRHSMEQDQINQLLLEQARQGKQVVRLKGGDPFLFGRGGEELSELAREGIDFEVVPGVTSALAVPAYQGIPVTHRGVASGVHFITGRRRDEEETIPYKALVECGGTLVFLMGLSRLGSILEGLREAGMRENVPAAVLSMGTTYRQRRVVATLGTLEQAVLEQRPPAPALILVGEVCGLAETFAWFEKKPLFGHRFVITRPEQRGEEPAATLRELGAQVVSLPTIETRPLVLEASARERLRNASRYDYVLFTSPFGVKTFFERLGELGQDGRSLASCQIGALGRGTEAALWERGIRADVVPEEYASAALGRAVARQAAAGARILVPRAREGSPQLVEQLQHVPNGIIHDVAIYETRGMRQVLEETDRGLGRVYERLLDRETTDFERTYFVFTSGSTVEGLVGLTEGEHEGAWSREDYGRVQALCIGASTAQVAARYGMKVQVAKEASVEGLLALAKQPTMGK